MYFSLTYLFKHECCLNTVCKNIFGMNITEYFKEQFWFLQYTCLHHLSEKHVTIT